MREKMYIMHLNERQLEVIRIALLLEYLELRRGNWDNFVREIVRIGQNINDEEEVSKREQALQEMLWMSALSAFKTAMNAAYDGYVYCESDFDVNTHWLYNRISKDSAKYVNNGLQVSEPDMKCIMIALEEYMHIRMNQWFWFADNVAAVGFMYNKADPENLKNSTRILTEEIRRKNCSHRQ